MILTVIFCLVFLTMPESVKASNIFYDDFNATISGDVPEKWATDTSDNWLVRNGEYGLKLYTPSKSNTFPKDQFWNNVSKHYSIDVDLKGISGTDKSVLFHYLDQQNFYAVHHSGGYIYLSKWTSNSPYGISIASPIYYPLENEISYHFNIVIDGDHIQIRVNEVLLFDAIDSQEPKIDNGKIALRVAPGASSPAEIWFDNVIVTDLSTPTPTPPTSLTTKVYFLPGMGASWNTSAFLNCTPDTNPDNWSLAPFAEDIYNPLFTTLEESGWNVEPFYYDWRQPVIENADILSTKIEEQLTGEEKANVIGHSMGGLIGKQFLDDHGDKLYSLLTLGSPFRGSALAYPPWAAGEIWNDNFLAKMVLTLYLKHCGGLFSSDRETIQNQVTSVQNLIPTEPFLRNIHSSDTYLPSDNSNKNNWSINFTNPLGVNVGTVAGTGYQTLNIIQTKETKQKDIKNGNWVDGSPTGKIYSFDGDGTVLNDSAIIPEASFNATVKQTHSGLVNSTEGINVILTFLGSSPIGSVSEHIETNSTLIVISPASFVLINPNGESKFNKNGLVSFSNPKSGSYRLNILSSLNETPVIVAQFLSNGNVKYKEYNLQGIGPKFHTINFDQGGTTEDMLF